MKKVRDHFFKKAKAEGYAARSVYKLQDLDGKFSLIKRGDVVLDLGCAPGSWLQYVSKRVGNRGRAVGVDLQPLAVALPANASFVKKDVFEIDPAGLAGELGDADVVLSDMAPKTTGVRLADQAASLELASRAAEVALAVLKVGGNFACKIFESAEVGALRKKFAQHFGSVHLFKPKASRSESFELFIVCLSRKPR